MCPINYYQLQAGMGTSSKSERGREKKKERKKGKEEKKLEKRMIFSKGGISIFI